MKHRLLVSLALAFRNISESECEVWLQRRQEDGPLDGKWEFPGGKIEADESPPVSAARELKEEAGLEAPWEKFISFKTYNYDYEDRSVCLFVHLLYFSTQSEYQKTLDPNGWKKVIYADPFKAEWASNIPAANKEILTDLCRYFEENCRQENWRTLWQQLSC